MFYNNDFYRSQFENYGGFYEEGSVKNTYRTINLNGDDWLIVNLDYHADEKVMAWANEVISSYPSHRTIIATHDSLGAHGQFSDYGAKLWNAVSSQHANVELVLSGHISYDNIVVTQLEGVHGNTVTAIVIITEKDTAVTIITTIMAITNNP